MKIRSFGHIVWRQSTLHFHWSSTQGAWPKWLPHTSKMGDNKTPWPKIILFGDSLTQVLYTAIMFIFFFIFHKPSVWFKPGLSKMWLWYLADSCKADSDRVIGWIGPGWIGPRHWLILNMSVVGILWWTMYLEDCYFWCKNRAGAGVQGEAVLSY